MTGCCRIALAEGIRPFGGPSLISRGSGDLVANGDQKWTGKTQDIPRCVWKMIIMKYHEGDFGVSGGASLIWVIFVPSKRADGPVLRCLADVTAGRAGDMLVAAACPEMRRVTSNGVQRLSQFFVS